VISDGPPRPGATAGASGFGRLLIVKLSALGDVAHALPIVDYLRRSAPEAEIDWAVDVRFAPLLAGHPGLRRVVALDIGLWRREWQAARTRRDVAEAVRSLRAARYDAAFDVQGNVKSGIVTFLSGAPLRFGFGRDGVREAPNLVFTNRKARLLPIDVHITQKVLRVASAPFGGAFDLSVLRAFVPTAPGDDARAAAIVRDLVGGAAPLLAVHAGTTWVTKKMDPGYWAEAIRSLRRRFPGLGILLTWGTENERREAEGILGMAGGAAGVAPRVTLKELAALYRACGYMMAPDTGPLHVAAAAGAKTVSVFRATDGNRNAPRGAGHRFLQAPLPCTACLRKRCDQDAACRASLSPEAAAEAMADLMDSRM